MKVIYILSLLMIPFWSFSQEISGHVYNENREPVRNITVSLKGSSLQTFTDAKGTFKMIVSLNAKTLQFSGTGFEKLDVPIDFKKEMSVQLITKITPLDEVQVIGYGTNSQRFNLGSVTKLKAEDIGRQAISNPLAALQGRVPGLVVTASSGLPGASFKVQIRGQNTLKSSSSQFVAPVDNPLFIIDGVPFAPQNENVNQFRSIASPGIGQIFGNPHGGLSPFSNLNPSDIESIEVLRDADATAIYGSKGGNGVILITTKRGKSGKTAVNINASTTLSRVGKTMPMMNTEQYLVMRNEAFKNDGVTPNAILYDEAQAPDILLFDPERYTDWGKDLMGNTAHLTSVNGTISGGTQLTQFRLGANYNRNTYVFKGGFADTKGGMMLNLNHSTANKKFSVMLSTNYSLNKNNSSQAIDLLETILLPPNFPSPLDDNGELVWHYKGANLDGYPAGKNPYSYLMKQYSMDNALLNSNLQLNYRLFDDLILKSSFGFSGLNSNEYAAEPEKSNFPDHSPEGIALFGNNDFTTWIVEPQLSYKKKIKTLLVDLLLGSSFQKNNNSSKKIEGSGYANDNLMGSISGADKRTVSDAYSEYKYAALFGRINLRLDDKYMLSLNARRDGSSRFGPDKQFGNFGSIGAGWLFSEEALIQDKFAFLSYGKLRGSYGITGSDAIGDYNFISRWAPSNYSYRGQLGYAPVNLFNPTFSWASTKKLEFGLEFGFLENKLLLNSTWYRNRSGNQLISYKLPAMTGFTSVVENWAAVVQNSGLEFTLQAPVLTRRNFSWNTAFNISVPKNKLLSFPNLAESSYATKYIVGESVGVLTGFKSAGVNPETGLFQFYDAQGAIVTTPKVPSRGDFRDFYTIGSLDPTFFGGIQNSLKIENFHLDVFMEFRKQLGLNYLGYVYGYTPGYAFNQPSELLKRWQVPGDSSPYQRFSTIYGDATLAAQNYSRSDAVYSDASFIRFRTISLSYTLSNTLIRRTGIQSIRIHANAQNLFTITNYKGNDPESQIFYGVPVLKTFGFGVQINL